jgi:hypothetical protein
LIIFYQLILQHLKTVDKLKIHLNQNVNLVENYIDSNYPSQLFPKNEIVHVNEGCVSSTKQIYWRIDKHSKTD